MDLDTLTNNPDYQSFSRQLKSVTKLPAVYILLNVWDKIRF